MSARQIQSSKDAVRDPLAEEKLCSRTRTFPRADPSTLHELEQSENWGIQIDIKALMRLLNLKSVQTIFFDYEEITLVLFIRFAAIEPLTERTQETGVV